MNSSSVPAQSSSTMYRVLINYLFNKCKIEDALEWFAFFYTSIRFVPCPPPPLEVWGHLDDQDPFAIQFLCRTFPKDPIGLFWRPLSYLHTTLRSLFQIHLFPIIRPSTESFLIGSNTPFLNFTTTFYFLVHSTYVRCITCRDIREKNILSNSTSLWLAIFFLS